MQQDTEDGTTRTAIYLHLIVVVSPMATQAYSQQLEHHLPLPAIPSSWEHWPLSCILCICAMHYMRHIRLMTLFSYKKNYVNILFTVNLIFFRARVPRTILYCSSHCIINMQVNQKVAHIVLSMVYYIQ